ncbi:MAG: TonB-dependent receptor [Gammaproteobacteria bacterium]|nr:TonB-dependent receptor [Gammaproteobacteria bacterium]
MKIQFRLPNTLVIGTLAAAAVALLPLAAVAADSTGDSAGVLEEVIVTGTHIARAGYETPTPVTTLAADELAAAAPSSIPDALNQLPQFTGSTSRTYCCQAGPSGNYINLRGLGSNGYLRSLVLLDGVRVTPTSNTGAVDLNLLPELLVSRVDIVTGGASAVYGSDAVSGVINYVIDNKFTGLKGFVQGGQSNYHDDTSVKAGLAGGSDFAGGRGHVVASFEHYKSDGVPDPNARPTPRQAWYMSGNGSPAAPYTNVPNANINVVSAGGVIVNPAAGGLPIATPAAPLAGTMFLPGGATAPFDFGTPIPGTSIAFRTGGSGVNFNQGQYVAAVQTDHLYLHLDYDLTPDIRGIARLNYAQSHTDQGFGIATISTANAFMIHSDNAYLPAAVQAQMTNLGLSSFRMARALFDLPRATDVTTNTTTDAMLGLEGRAWGSFKWSLVYTNGKTTLDEQVRNNINFVNLFAAIDAVRGPSGQVVCRVTLTYPGTAPGCVPINLFGVGAASKAATDFVLGTDENRVVNRQQSLAFNLQGEAFDLPAGPLSMAIGAEHRQRSLDETASPLGYQPVNVLGLTFVPPVLCPQAPANVTNCVSGAFKAGNYGPASGTDHVTEGYVEAAVPLLAGMPAIHRLELNGAFRYTNYTTVGNVHTWKLGLNYEPIDSLRFRATRSTDIRAPNLYELYSSPVTGFAYSFFDLRGNHVVVPVPQVNQGNPNLQAEKADTYTIGLVYAPTWLQGFSAAIDYYHIDLRDMIGPNTAQNVIDSCIANPGTSACDALTLDTSGNVTSITVQNINAQSLKRSGVDIDAAYSRRLGATLLNLRGLFSYTNSYTQKLSPGAPNIQFAGENPLTVTSFPSLATPKWRGTLSAEFAYRDFSAIIQERYIQSLRLVGYSGGATGTPLVFAQPDLPTVLYTDLTARLGFKTGGAQLQAYATVNNLFNKQPPVLGSFLPGLGFPTVPTLYDLVGRYYSVGIRARL